MVSGEDHSGRADAALRAAAVEEGLLQELCAGVLGEAFYGDDVCAMGLKHGNKATVDERAVEQNGAGATFAFAAAFFCAGEREIEAENIQEAGHRVSVDGFG